MSAEQWVYVEVFRQGKHVYSAEFESAIELGRQQQTEEAPFRLVPPADLSGPERLIIAPLKERSIPRQFVSITRQQQSGRSDEVLIKNLSPKVALDVGRSRLAPENEISLPLPTTLDIGEITVRLLASKSDFTLQHLAHPTLSPSDDVDLHSVRASLQSTFGNNHDGSQILRWIQSLLPILKSATNSPGFVKQAAEAVLAIVNLDAAAVLLLKDGQWETQSQAFARAELPEWQPSRFLLDRVVADKQTITAIPNSDDITESIRVVQSVVAAPILDARQDVIGVIYGDRRKGPTSSPLATGISEEEAAVIQLLAGAVSLGMARMEQEAAADEARMMALQAQIQFEQFFSPQLAQEYARDPNIVLVGRNATVSVLFADIRGFSSISKRIGPEQTVKWIGDVMSELSECVLENDGVVVDYIGDELMAMWGAPQEQADHAVKASLAAAAMLELVPKLADRWEEQLGQSFGLGIGINSGPAYVGNTGTPRRLKFGPLGNSVNVASRVQGVNKFFGTSLLATENTVKELQTQSDLEYRRLANVRVVGIPDPFPLFELVQSPEPGWRDLSARYEEALKLFEDRHFRQASVRLAQILIDHEKDQPTLQLLSRCVEALTAPSESFEPVVNFQQK